MEIFMEADMEADKMTEERIEYLVGVLVGMSEEDRVHLDPICAAIQAALKATGDNHPMVVPNRIVAYSKTVMKRP